MKIKLLDEVLKHDHLDINKEDGNNTKIKKIHIELMNKLGF